MSPLGATGITYLARSFGMEKCYRNIYMASITLITTNNDTYTSLKLHETSDSFIGKEFGDFQAAIVSAERCAQC